MKKEVKSFILICPLALLTLVIPSLLSGQILTLLSLSLISVLMLLIDRNKKDLILYLLVFISGPIAESIAIHFGIWNYKSPLFIGVPIWLPFVWGNAGLYIIKLWKVINKVL